MCRLLTLHTTPKYIHLSFCSFARVYDTTLDYILLRAIYPRTFPTPHSASLHTGLLKFFPFRKNLFFHHSPCTFHPLPFGGYSAKSKTRKEAAKVKMAYSSGNTAKISVGPKTSLPLLISIKPLQAIFTWCKQEK